MKNKRLQKRRQSEISFDDILVHAAYLRLKWRKLRTYQKEMLGISNNTSFVTEIGRVTII